MMHKLEVKLKQHTPLIHFQHDQEGATLRASEVKPKLDKYILTQLGGGNYEKGKEEAKAKGWLIGKGSHPALDYKIKVEAGNEENIMMNDYPINKNDGIGQPLFSTRNYPDDRNSMIMGNMGGRVRTDLLNFVLSDYVNLFIHAKDENLLKQIRNYITVFFAETNLGNRTSKGFGSFLVDEIDGEKASYDIAADLTISYQIVQPNNERISNVKGMKTVFFMVNTIWKNLKKYRYNKHVPSQDLRNVFLNTNNNIPPNVARVPSPIYFKPIISKNRDKWSVDLLVFLNFEVIKSGNSKASDFYDILEKDVNKILQNEYHYPVTDLTIEDIILQ